MSLVDPQIPKEYQNGRVLFEQNLDAWRESVEDYFVTINLNLTQLRKDAFLANYDFDNDGNANLPKNLQQQINDLTSGATPIGGTTSDTWTINSDGNSSILSTVGLTAVRTYTFPDASGVLVVANSTQTLSNKTFSDNIVWSSGVASTGTLDHANTANRIYTFPDFSGTIVLNGSGGSVPFLGNVDVYSGFDFRAYSDAGGTLKASIDGATGNFVGDGSANVFGASNVGASNGLTIRNTDNTNTASNATFLADVGGASGGDPVLVWRINGVQDCYLGVDNSDSDKWEFGTGAIVGTNPKLTFDTANNRWAFFHSSPTTDIDIRKALVGATLSQLIWNTDNTDANSEARMSLATGGASGGTPVYDLVINGVAGAHIALDNADDLFKIGYGGWPAFTSALIINSTDEVLMRNIDPPTANYMNRNSSSKAWCTVDGPTGTLLGENYNIDSVSRTALGTFTINLDTNHSTAQYPVWVSIIEILPLPSCTSWLITNSGTYQVFLYDAGGGVAIDHDFSTGTFGTQ